MMDATERITLIYQKSGEHQKVLVVNACNHLRPAGRGGGKAASQQLDDLQRGEGLEIPASWRMPFR